MTALSIWFIALLVYAIFYFWYVGFRAIITAAEVDEVMASFDGHTALTDNQTAHLRYFFARDDGKDFVMVNLLQLKEPRRESNAKLSAYQKIFLGSLLRKAGHPVLIARAASGNIENVDCHEIDSWTAAGMIRYRSRRDLMEILSKTFGSGHHGLKLDALDKTFAFPAAPWSILGGPKLLVPMTIALLAALAQIALI